MELTPATATDETYDLYLRYQIAIHKDPPGKVKRHGFESFLCNSPLNVSLSSQTWSALAALTPEHAHPLHVRSRHSRSA